MLEGYTALHMYPLPIWLILPPTYESHEATNTPILRFATLSKVCILGKFMIQELQQVQGFIMALEN